MNKINRPNSLIVNPSTFNELLQQQAYKNVENLLNALFGDDYGVFCNLGSQTVPPKDDYNLKVEKHSGNEVKVSPGLARDPEGNMIVLGETRTIEVPGDGTYIVYAMYAEVLRAPSGQSYLPAGSGETNMSILLDNGCSLGIVEYTVGESIANTIPNSSIPLALVFKDDGSLSENQTATLEETISATEGEIATSTIIGKLSADLGFNFLRIDDEYVEVDDGYGTMTLNVTRGKYKSQSLAIRSGAEVVWSPIIELRQWHIPTINLGNLNYSTYLNLANLDIETADYTIAGLWTWATGGAPFSVDENSNDVVANLNADMIDGFHASVLGADISIEGDKVKLLNGDGETTGDGQDLSTLRNSIKSYTASGNFAKGDVGYRTSEGVNKLEGNTGENPTKMLVVALDDISDGESGNFLLEGVDSIGNTTELSTGNKLWIGPDGSFNSEAPATTGSIVRLLGYVESIDGETFIQFRPSMLWYRVE